MSKWSEQVDFVVGVDTHKASHTGAIVDVTGAVHATHTLPADAFGYRRLLAFARSHAPTRRIWAIEGTGSFGRGLTTFLLEQQEHVVEIDRPARPARRNGAKADDLDAVRAAREVLTREYLAEPRRRGDREAMRVLLRTRQGAINARQRAMCHLQALVVTAPQALRKQLQAKTTKDTVVRCARLRTTVHHSTEHRATIAALRATARRILMLEAEADDHESQLQDLVRAVASPLLNEPGVGVLSAAELLCAWSHRGRIRSEAAFATLAGVAPIPASSGKVVRYRLNRGGDRQLNRALHTIVLSRLTHHAETQAYRTRRVQEGKTPREIKRCLKRHLIRQLFKLLQRLEGPHSKIYFNPSCAFEINLSF
jgi:transposase